MIAESIRRYRRILSNIRSGKILNKIGSGKRVFFENPSEGIAFKYIPGEPGKPGKYFAKQFGRNESEIGFDSSFVIAVMKGNQISKARYDKHHSFESVFSNGNNKISDRSRQLVISG
jgi:hypothetical protein